MNFLIVCGGTGGHLFPGMAVGEELLERRHQVALVVSEKAIDRKAVERAQGMLILSLPAVGWRGLLRAPSFALGMFKAYSCSRQIFKDFSPAAILGMGGFSSVAPLLLAKKRGIPSCIHESNAIAGKANRLAARFANQVATGFERVSPSFDEAKSIWTGTPVRRAIRGTHSKEKARAELGLDLSKPVVLVMGGSQGARGLNRLATEAAKNLSFDMQWLHLTGEKEEEVVRQSYLVAGKTATVFSFFHDVEKLYAAADLIVARAGASSLAEIAECALPAILIPFPFATDLHQHANARLHAQSGAAIVREEDKTSGQELASDIQDILTNSERRNSMAQATKALRHQEAHKRLADVLEKLGASPRR